MRMVLSGGGTGGHIYPALAIARKLKQINPDSAILYVGTKKGLEQKLVKEEDFEFTTVTARGWARKINLETFYFILDLAKGILESLRLIKKFAPQVTVGTGGYVCGPILIASKLKGVPIIIHEQNVIPGITNRIFSRFADCTCVSFPESKEYFKKAKRIEITGNPRAEALMDYMKRSFQNRTHFRQVGLKQGQTLLIVGGSRGAEKINQAVLEIMPDLVTLNINKIVYITGERYYKQVLKALQSFKFEKGAEKLSIYPYMEDLPGAILASTLVISRAGATTIAELTAAAKPAILIPSPNVTDEHQWLNAVAMRNRGAARIMKEGELSGEQLKALVKEIIENPALLEEMKLGATKLQFPRAASTICEIAQQLAKRKPGVNNERL